MSDELKKLIEPHGPIDWGSFSKLSSYYDLACHWNKAVNLVSRNDEENRILNQFEDSIYAFFAFKKSRFCSSDLKEVADIGTGGGFPGLVWACLSPQHLFSLVEVSEKKCFFLEEVVRKLKLDNVEVHNQAVKDFTPKSTDTLLLSRATGLEIEIQNFLKRAKCRKGCLFFYSNKQAAAFTVQASLSYSLPVSNKQRKLVLLGSS